MATRTYTREVDKPRNSINSSEQWSTKQKFEAVALYKLLGNLVEVSAQTRIPVQTLRQWHIKDWWKDYELEIAQGSRSKLSAKLERVRDRAIAVVEDRLEHGDFVFDQKTGQILRKPVNAQTAGKILVDTVDKSILIDKLNQEHKLTMSIDKMSDRIATLHETFGKLARKSNQKPLGDVIDVEVVPESLLSDESERRSSNAVHEEREAGLQEGASPGARPSSGEGEGASGEEFRKSLDWVEGWRPEASGPQDTSFEGGFELQEQPEGSVSTPE